IRDRVSAESLVLMTDLATAEAAAAKARRRPLLSPRFVQAMLAGHSALGLAFAALIYVVCLTGTISVFLHELHRWEQPNAPLITQPLRAEAVNEAVWSAYGQALIDKAAEDITLMAPGQLSPRFLITYHSTA